METVMHQIPPVFDHNSKILVLGSFPSVKSRQGQFFYHHPQNRFWKVLAGITGEVVPQTIEEKKYFLINHRIAVWDVIESCEIEGSSDSSIRNVVPNDISRILNSASIRAIYTNGATADRLYQTYIKPKIGIDATKLPSTSPANAAFTPDRLMAVWSQIVPLILSARPAQTNGEVMQNDSKQ